MSSEEAARLAAHADMSGASAQALNNFRRMTADLNIDGGVRGQGMARKGDLFQPVVDSDVAAASRLTRRG